MTNKFITKIAEIQTHVVGKNGETITIDPDAPDSEDVRVGTAILGALTGLIPPVGGAYGGVLVNRALRAKPGEKHGFFRSLGTGLATMGGVAAGTVPPLGAFSGGMILGGLAPRPEDIQKHAALNELMDSGVDFDSAVELVKQASGDWMEHAVKHPGALHEELGIPEGKKIPASTLARAAKAGGKLGMRARLAEQFKKADAKKK
jgi:hypothetical protein